LILNCSILKMQDIVGTSQGILYLVALVNFFLLCLFIVSLFFFYVVNKDEHKLHHKGPLL